MKTTPLNKQKKAHFGWKRILGTVAAAAVFGFFLLTIFAAWITSDLPDPERLQDRVIAESTKMFDRTGTHLLYEVYDQKKRTVVDIATLPPYVAQSTIAIEDEHFYEHSGVRWTSILRAIIADTLHLSSGQGGASTLTQQLVKNAILTDEHSFTRKIKEAVLALQIERVYTKDQILKLYFNEIPYGSTNYGIESAAQAYFGKSAKDLTLAEAATLAAMPQAPTRYMQNPDLLKGRRDYILDRMFADKYITAAQRDQAKAQTSNIKVATDSSVAPHFVMYIKDQLVNSFGEQTVDQGGLKVITTLDYDAQVAANTAIANGVANAEKKYGASNGAALVLDPSNGQILAMVGSRNFSDPKQGGQFNVVTQGIRQPGSSFKPIVYSAAFEKGFPTETVLYDTKTDFPYDTQTYSPQNYDSKEHGPVTMRQALQGSLNIPAVKTIFLVGVDRALDFAQRLGYSTFKDRSQFGPSIVLGGGGVKMIDHARAYAAFANGGNLVQPIGILKIEDKNGNDVTPQIDSSTKQVLAPEIAATISNVLSDNPARAYIFGLKNFLTLPDRQVAVKTGTTNDYKDAWTIGYTPQVVAAVWVGNNDNTSMKRGADGSIVAAPIWQQIMMAVTKKLPAVDFPLPPPSTATNPMLQGLTNGALAVRIDTVSGKLATPNTPPETTVQKFFVPPHDILFYVDPENPLGPPPADPTQNPEYAAWETGVQNWIAKQKATGTALSFENPPTQFDDVHVAGDKPTLEVTAPKNGDVITGDLNAQVNVGGAHGVAHVDYRLDGNLVGSAASFPFGISVPQNELTKGAHTLQVTVVDSVQNTTSQQITFTAGAGVAQ